MTISLRWIWAPVVVGMLAWSTTNAHAGRTVDWGPYLEQPGDRPPPRRATKTPVASKSKAKAAVASKAKTKAARADKQKARSKARKTTSRASKAKAKKSRAKSRRR